MKDVRLFIIDKETGDAHELKGHADLFQIPDQDEIEDAENAKIALPKTYEFEVRCRISKRKARKWKYEMDRLIRKSYRKYVSKCEIVDRIFKEFDNQPYSYIDEPREWFMKHTHRELLTIYNHACMMRDYYGIPTEEEIKLANKL